MQELFEIYKALLKILIQGIIIAAITIGLIILTLSILKQCTPVKQTQNVQSTFIL